MKYEIRAIACAFLSLLTPGFAARGQTNTNLPPMPGINAPVMAINAAAATNAPARPRMRNLILGWGYSTNDPANSFVIRMTTNAALPPTNWTILTNVPSTNCFSGILQGDDSFTNGVCLAPGQYYFSIQCSNLWSDGLSPLSNIINTPQPPVPVFWNGLYVQP